MDQTKIVLHFPNIKYRPGIIIINMISSYSKNLTDRKLCTLTFHHHTQVLSILVMDEENDTILYSKIGKEHLPSFLIKIFCKQMKEIYQFLTTDTTAIKIEEKDGEIKLNYTLILMGKRQITNFVVFPTKKYLPFNFTVNKIQSIKKAQQKAHQTQQQISPFIKKDALECQYNFQLYNDSSILSSIKPIQNHLGWYSNEIQNTCLQLSDNLSKAKASTKEGIFKYSLRINVNQHHKAEISHPRYDFTIGLASHQKIVEMREAIQPNFTNTLSASVDNRSITSYFMDLTEQREFSKSPQPKRLQIWVSVKKSQSAFLVNSIQIVMRGQSEQILVNIWSESNLASSNHNLVSIDDYYPFVYFARSYLHFSFGSDGK